jgi:hypothetical protein
MIFAIYCIPSGIKAACLSYINISMSSVSLSELIFLYVETKYYQFIIPQVSQKLKNTKTIIMIINQKRPVPPFKGVSKIPFYAGIVYLMVRYIHK